MKNESSSDRSRRNFIKTSSIAGVGVLLAGTSILNAGKRPKKKSKGDDINIAIIGFGAQGSMLVQLLLKIPGVRFKAVCDIWEKFSLKRGYRTLLKYKHDVRRYINYREMLEIEKDLDAVIIATPDFMHAPHTIACLEAGLHVYCEAGMSDNLQSAQKMVETSRRKSRLLQIGYHMRSDPRYIFAKKNILDSKMLGRITDINSYWNLPPYWDRFIKEKFAIEKAVLNRYGYKNDHQFRNWRWYKKFCGGPIVDRGSHQIDVINWFLDKKPASVTADGGIDSYKIKKYNTIERNVNMTALFTYMTAGEVSVRASCKMLFTQGVGYSLAAPDIIMPVKSMTKDNPVERFIGSDGSLTLNANPIFTKISREYYSPGGISWKKWEEKGYIKMIENKNGSGPWKLGNGPWELGIEPDKKPLHMPHLENFIDAIRKGAPLNCPGETGYATLATALKVNDAIEAEKKLYFKPEDFKS